MIKTYFAEDGSYGNADNIALVDTDDWTPEEWETIDETPDWERPGVAEKLARKHGAKRWEVWYRDYETGARLPLCDGFYTEADANAYINDRSESWEFPVWVQESEFCSECWETIGNSVTEEVNGYTTCHSCLTHPKGE